MSERGHAACFRRPRARHGAFVAFALITLVVAGAAAVAACGGSSSADIGLYAGAWQRVDGGTPDPHFLLTVTAQSDAATVTFANLSNGQQQTVPATLEDGYLACTLPNGDDLAASPAPGVPAQSDLQLSLDENGQLVVDLVLTDGTLEPIWIYDRPPASTPAEP